MKQTIIVILIAVLWTSSYGQSKEEKEILKEADKLYKSEMASWFGTDIFMEKFADRRERIGGYLSYVENEKATCIFFSQGDSPQVIGSFTFDSTYNVSTALVDGQE